MKSLSTIALAALLSTGTIVGAHAMPAMQAPAGATATAADVELVGHHRYSHRILPKHVVQRSLQRRGYRHIRNMRLVRGDYFLTARGHRGEVRLRVDGRTGRILSRQALHHRPHRPGIRLHGGNGNFSYSFGIH